jgi:Arc/MetJ-type ribon-helix-helix transcriptional regulator
MTKPFLPELETFIEQQVADGHFADRHAVLECALRLLQADREEAKIGVQAALKGNASAKIQPAESVFENLRRFYP